MRFLDLPPLFDLPHITPREVAETSADVLTWLTGEPLYIIGLIVFAFVVRWILHRSSTASYDARRPACCRPGCGATATRRRSRGAPARSRPAGRCGHARWARCLKSIISAVVFTVLVIMVLAELGYNIAPILAGPVSSASRSASAPSRW
jgi:small conductance mechanosensitive channel